MEETRDEVPTESASDNCDLGRGNNGLSTAVKGTAAAADGSLDAALSLLRSEAWLC